MLKIKKEFSLLSLIKGVFASLLLFGLIITAHANADPVGCVDNGGGISIGAFRADGITSIGASDKVLDGELVKYRATLSALPFPPNCAYEGGSWTLTTPDSIIHPLSAVPRIGGTGVLSLLSSFIDYVVTHGHEISSVITATSAYSGGISHANTGDNTPGPVLGASKIILVMHPSTKVSITASSSQVAVGESTVLTITETNDGDTPLSSPNVVVDNGVGTLIAPPTTGDTGNDGILGIGETWSWTVSSGSINASTTFTATGHGSANGMDVTWCANTQSPPAATLCDQDERASVNVTVVKSLVIEKTAQTSYDKKWNWTIDKIVDKSTIVLQSGASSTVNYDVTVNSSSTNMNHVVSGTITVTNPIGNPIATVTSVVDDLNITVANPTVNCSANPLGFSSFPHTLAAGESLICTYNGTSTGTDSQNQVTISTQGAVVGGTSTAAVIWGTPTNEIDECADVSDPNENGSLLTDTICANETLPHTYKYDLTFGPAGALGVDVAVTCGVINHPNTAQILTNDTQTIASDNVNVSVTVDCSLGCTLTQGYWKTHNNTFKGGASPDAEWFDLLPPLGENTIFYLSGASWFNVFWTAPKGNAYYNLAHQFMAAKLNISKGASVPADVATAISSATALFETKTPAQVATLKGAAKQTWVNLAGTLGSYNEGLIGPGHCK